MADEQQFDLQQLLSNPWTQVGMSLLGASQQRNPYQAALQNMMQLQQQQQALQQQQQQRQQQVEAFALQQKARQQALDQEARRQQFLQGQQQQLLGAGPPTPADQQRLMLLGGLEAGLSPTELGAIKQPTDEELAAKRIKLAGGQGYFEYNPQTKQMEFKSLAPAGGEKQPNYATEKIPTETGTKTIRRATGETMGFAPYGAKETKVAETKPKPADRIPMEVIRMDIGRENVEKTFERWKELLKDFDPRSTDQFDTAKLGALKTIGAEMVGQGKEALGLGALQDADVTLMTNLAAFPNSFQGALLGKKGLNAQITELETVFKNRKETLYGRYPNLAKQRAEQDIGPPKLDIATPTQEELEYAANKRGITVDEVKRRLGIK